MSTFSLEIITPEQIVVKETVRFVSVKGIEGELGILPQHIPMVTLLRIAPVVLEHPTGERMTYAVHGGILQISSNGVVILAEGAEDATSIDVSRAQQAKQRAQQRLQQQRDERIDYARAERALARALLRIDVSQR